MTGILGKLHVQHTSHGARVLARSAQLNGICASESEIDVSIHLLKDDLEACAKQMKRLLAIDRSGSLFEGWPSARYDLAIG